MTRSEVCQDGGEYDVIVVGGGPVGLLLGYQLKRFGVSVCVLEQHKKEIQDAYGRAIALFPRTLEQLDQLDLIEPMLQLGFACRTSVTYKDGERIIPGRVWSFMENIQDTTYDFVLVLRQMYTEQIFRDKLESLGADYYQGYECVDFQCDENKPSTSQAVVATFKESDTGRIITLKSKYFIGADGGRSFVRRHAGIPFEGDSSDDQWVRIDGLVETDMPLNRSYGAIESKTHGNVLWAPLDHAATRIGYAYTSEIAAKYPDGVSQKVAVQEAVESMKPFNVKFKEVHWWTLYQIGQRIAKDFSKERVFLCGDAAHTHSSGAAQGLNTGIHDAVNLGWKLALHIRGIVKENVLDTYDLERKHSVQQLIDYDRDISILMSRKWPSWYEGDPDADPYIVLGEIFEQAASFNTGLGISYPINDINQILPDGAIVAPGSRPPDVELITPGTKQTVRLQRLTRNFANFWVIVFAGNPGMTHTSLVELGKSLGTFKKFKSREAIGWLTISAVAGNSPYETLGMKPFGDTFFDPTNSAHERVISDEQKLNDALESEITRHEKGA
ncbi:hypothetical protein N7448_009416 [Penicillium atrosanguineum]|nr:hypothetical protein N7448_009416 [Penicillium atrosanguineum]KAJ5141951.1 hypothetical protein N7526_002946 [Penicillium atrosanguineum]